MTEAQITEAIKNEIKSRAWHVSTEFGRTAVYADSSDGIRITVLPEQKQANYQDRYEYIVKLHNDRLRFKQKQRAKKNRKDGYVKTNPIKESYIDGNGKWIVNGISFVPNTNRKTCRCCKTCKEGCEFYDKGICRGIVYPTNPPQYDKCEFDK